MPLVPPAAVVEAVRGLDGEVQRHEGARAAAEKRVAERAARPARLLATGQFDNGGAQEFAAGEGAPSLRAVAVRKGDLIQLTVLPRANHGADSTLVELEIAEQGGPRVWNVTRDVLADSYGGGRGNPHGDGLGRPAVWSFLDVAAVPTLLGTFVRDAEKTPGLLAWRGGSDWPAVLVNVNARPISFQTVKQPARSLAVHPGPRGGVAVAWESPIDGTVSVAGRVQDIDSSGGDGIAWTLAVRPGLGEDLVTVRDATAARDQAARKKEAYLASLPRAYAVAEGSPHNARLQRRGDPNSLGDEVPRRSLQLLGGQPVPPGAGSGRLELARWLTDPANPLTARVLVNRVWQGHFGAGLVRTANDFGTRGEPPTHPDLLDYLAAQFVAGGWSLKALHRDVLLSDAYQRSSVAPEETVQADPANLLLARFPRRRLPAEAIRDAMLAVSEVLDPTPGRDHPFPPEGSWGFTQHGPFSAVYDHNRRSVYLMTQRIKRHPFLALFDGADTSSSTAARFTTTVPTQALFFLNDPFVHARAAGLAARLQALPDDTARLTETCRRLFGRPPTTAEREAAAGFLESYAASLTGVPASERGRQAWEAWVRVLLSGNEFIYVD